MQEQIFFEGSYLLYEKTERTIDENNLIKPSDSVLVAVSGGPDSMALMHILYFLSQKTGFRLGAAHVNHCLRGEESDQDAIFTENAAKRLGIEFHAIKTDAEAYRIENRLSPEEAARKVRFNFLYGVMDKYGYSRLATAHHSDDNAELVLMNIIRGTGPDGLEGMKMNSPENRIIRPFLRTTRDEIDFFLENSDIPFRMDSSNENEELLRNRVRKSLIPHIENRFNGRIREALNRLSDIMAIENEYMTEEADRFFNDVVDMPDNSPATVKIDRIINLHEAVSRRIIRKTILLIKGDLKRISQNHIDEILSLSKRDYDCELHIPGQIRVVKEKDRIILRRETASLRTLKPEADYEYMIDDFSELPFEIPVEEAGIRIRFRKPGENETDISRCSGADKILLDMDSTNLPLIIRNTRNGDRFTPIGMNGSKKVLRFMMDIKIPEPLRKVFPVMESGGEILWSPGKRLSEKLRLRHEKGNYMIAEIVC
jgi:tRNA(Ile)-lysidine synthase